MVKCSSALLLIRADASAQIGVGHVMRTLALAQEWRDTVGPVTFACSQLPSELFERLIEEHIGFAEIRSTSGTECDALETLDLATETSADALVVDGYTFRQKYHDVIEKFRGATLVLDDYGHLLSYKTDFVLNQNLGVNAVRYSERADRTQLLLGPQYALIRQELLNNNYLTRGRDGSIARILVTLGGSDPDNITEKVARALLWLDDPDISFRIVVGASYVHHAQLLAVVSGDSRFEVIRSARNMAEQYAWADLVVAAGGSSNWEMCCYSLPRLLVVIAENQVPISAELQRAGIAVNLGWGRDFSPAVLQESIRKMQLNPDWVRGCGRQAGAIVDGKGAARVTSELLKCVESR